MRRNVATFAPGLVHIERTNKERRLCEPSNLRGLCSTSRVRVFVRFTEINNERNRSAECSQAVVEYEQTANGYANARRYSLVVHVVRDFYGVWYINIYTPNTYKIAYSPERRARAWTRFLANDAPRDDYFLPSCAILRIVFSFSFVTIDDGNMSRNNETNSLLVS